jgi:Protein of unknown function (DUF2867)
MTLPRTAHTSQPWRIHELTPDFRVEDVWALPAHGARQEFPALVEGFARGNTSEGPSVISRMLFALRWKLGEWLGWDDPGTGVGARVHSLRERLPADLRERSPGPAFSKLPFSSLYMLENEWAAEIANNTMHGVLHLGWVPDDARVGDEDAGDAHAAEDAHAADSRQYHGQMAVLVKPNGLMGNAYMAAIRPFRHAIVYPALLRQIEREWRARASTAVHTHA